MAKQAKRIQTLEELKAESRDGAEFFILLNFHLRSSKWIKWEEETQVFIIHNYIDESEQVLSETEIMDEGLTNIGRAMKLGAFFSY